MQFTWELSLIYTLFVTKHTLWNFYAFAQAVPFWCMLICAFLKQFSELKSILFAAKQLPCVALHLL